MKRVLFAAFAVALASASPVFAQTLVPAAQADQANANWATSSAATARVVALLAPITNDARVRAARRPQDYTVLLNEKSAAIAAARIELQDIATRLSAMPSVAEATDPVAVRLSEQSIDDAAAFAPRADAMLGRMQDLSAALAAEDRARIQATSSAMLEGGALILDYQALVFRSAMANHPEGSSAHARDTITSCFYEGAAAYQRGAFGLSPAAEAVSKVRESTGCLRSQAAIGREALAREQAVPEADFSRRMVRLQLRTVTGRVFTALETAASPLDESARELERRGPSPALATRYMPALMEVERQLMQIQTNEDQIIRDANRTR